MSRRKIRLHREIIEDVPPGFEVDHINGNKLDNRRENLRVVRHSVNCHNTPVSKSSKTGVKNVYPANRLGRLPYYAQVRVDGVCYCLGSFATILEAKDAVERWKQKHIPGYDLRSRPDYLAAALAELRRWGHEPPTA
jgi:hypothetical protein